MKVFNVLLLVAAAVESITALSEVDCSKPPLTGPCRGYFTRYYYNPKTGRCETFLYGGCRGNKNNFLSEDECYQQCGAQKCGENAHYDECGTQCPLTCGNYQNPPDACAAVCVQGCHCDEGFVKAKDGRCVKPEDCPVKCGSNAHFESCGTDCPLTCDNYDNPPEICNLSCRIGCQCDKGYVQTKDGRCVKPKDCPVKRSANCRKNEEFVECGTACPLTCDNYDNPPEFCIALCVIGCQCKDGFVRSQGGRCVRPEQCPKIPPLPRHDIRTECPPNKEYGSFGDCPDSCYSLEHPVRACTLKLNYGCKCMPGYVLKEDKDFDSDCIKPEECPSDVWG